VAKRAQEGDADGRVVARLDAIVEVPNGEFARGGKDRFGIVEAVDVPERARELFALSDHIAPDIALSAGSTAKSSA
jgi:hypothetical protein